MRWNKRRLRLEAARIHFLSEVFRRRCCLSRGTQGEDSSNPLKHSTVKRILVFKR